MDNWTKYENKLLAIAANITWHSEVKKDLVQEMRIAIWQASSGHKDAYYLSRAKSRALNYIYKYYPSKLWQPQTKTGFKVRRESPTNPETLEQTESSK